MTPYEKLMAINGTLGTILLIVIVLHNYKVI
jgi:hypothetical protein